MRCTGKSDAIEKSEIFPSIEAGLKKSHHVGQQDSQSAAIEES